MASMPLRTPPQIPFLETPLVGQNGPDAGFWATRAKECPWQKAFKLKKKPSENLHTLIALPTQREPALRKEEDPLEFNNHVSQKKSNIEALLAQAVGAEVPTNAKEKGTLIENVETTKYY
jgi:hypothetical protein